VDIVNGQNDTREIFGSKMKKHKGNKMKKKKQKCDYCNKVVDKPYKFTVVPTARFYEGIKPYSKKAPKIKRTDLEDEQKVNVYHYCNNECCIDHASYR